MTTDRNSEGAVAWEVTDPRGNKTTRMGADRPNLTEPGWSARPLAYAGFRIVQVDFTPPASIPAAEVQALVERLDRDALLFGEEGTVSGDVRAALLRDIRQRLAKLIPRGK